MSTQPPIYVTQPDLPPLEEFMPYLQKIWDSKVLTNGGPFHQQLETELAEYLGVKHISLFTNATIALVTALQSMRISGEVITTPYSFVATAHSLLWNGIKPVFVDIDPATLNLDPTKIEAAITPQTTAIMPLHCYGRPCDVEAIQRIADDYNLKVIYDAAHAFGVRQHGQSILQHGDLSILSFHATKVFNTKMSEFNAALGLLQLKHVDKAIGRRRAIDALYRSQLAGVQGIRLLSPADDTDANQSYFPILVEADYPLSRDALYQQMKDIGIYGRRYFYPLISDFPMYRGLPSANAAQLPVARDVSSKVICLPIYPALTDEEVGRVTGLIRQTVQQAEALHP
jgi:dTDP-4-amino-4,6-dideoxygalactose transaminase